MEWDNTDSAKGDSYFVLLWRDAWRKMCVDVFKYHKIIPSLLGSTVIALLYWIIFEPAKPPAGAVTNAAKTFLVGACSLVVIHAAMFIYCLFRASERLYEQEVDIRIQAESERDAIQKKIDAKPKLELSLASETYLKFDLALVPIGREGQVKIAIKNLSENSTVHQVELTIMSVEPSRTSNNRAQANVVMEEGRKAPLNLTPLESSNYPVLNYIANTFALNIQFPQRLETQIDVSRYGKVCIRLRAKSEETLPAFATLVMIGDLKEMNLSLIPD